MDVERYRKTLANQAVLVEAARQAFDKAGHLSTASDRAIERDTLIFALTWTYDDSIEAAPDHAALRRQITARAKAEQAEYIKALVKSATDKDKASS